MSSSTGSRPSAASDAANGKGAVARCLEIEGDDEGREHRILLFGSIVSTGVGAPRAEGPGSPGTARTGLFPLARAARCDHGGAMTTDRLGIDVLETDTCLELLRRSEVGRLAVSITDHPDIFPVNFMVDRGTIVIRTAEGTKLAAAVLGRAVAFEVDGYDADSGEAWSVVLKGRAVEIDQMEELFDALDLPLFPWHSAPKHHFVRIEPRQISGRRFHVVDDEAWGGPRPDVARASEE